MAMACATALLSEATVHASILPWLSSPSEKEAAREPAIGRGLELVREEARLIQEMLDYMSLASSEEVRRTFAQTSVEAHLADALLCGGAAGTAPASAADPAGMLKALRAAAVAGSVWAPLWLGDLEHVGNGHERTAIQAARRRGWYNEALQKGHPDALGRLAEIPSDAHKNSDPRGFFAQGSQFFLDVDATVFYKEDVGSSTQVGRRALPAGGGAAAAAAADQWAPPSSSKAWGLPPRARL